jgi:histone deacetylase 1/2
MLIYVDDIIIAGSCSKTVNQLLGHLRDSFAIKDLGELAYFLGIEVTRQSNGIALTQSKYAADLLRKLNMQLCKVSSTPMSASDKLSTPVGAPLSSEDAFVYRSTVGALQYLCMTRPDISFCGEQGLSVLGCSDRCTLGCNQADSEICQRDIEYRTEYYSLDINRAECLY